MSGENRRFRRSSQRPSRRTIFLWEALSPVALNINDTTYVLSIGITGAFGSLVLLVGAFSLTIGACYLQFKFFAYNDGNIMFEHSAPKSHNRDR